MMDLWSAPRPRSVFETHDADACMRRFRSLQLKHGERLAATFDTAACCYVVLVTGKDGREVALKCPKGYADDTTLAQIMLVLE